MDEQAPSPQTTLAILIGASEWPEAPDFPGSKAFSNTMSRFRSYLFDPRGFGLPKENALDLFDDSSGPHVIDRKIRQFLDSKIAEVKLVGNGAKDLLLYFVGHGGFVGRNSDYYLAVRCTSTEDARLSGIPMESLASTLTDKARYLRRIIILDCCYAAAAFTSFQAEGPAKLGIDQTFHAFEKKAKTVGKGTTLLCSSGKTVASQIAQDQSGTMFSKALLQVLSTGDEHRQEQQYFSLREVADLTEEVITRELEGKAPRPEIHSPDQREGDVATIPFFPNLGARERQLAFPQTGLICPTCQHVNRFGAKYCVKDGQPLTLGISVQSSPDALIASSMPWQGIKTLRAVAFCTLQGHVSSVHRVAWSPDGKYLASAGSDKKVFVWEVRTGQHISLYSEHSDEVLCVAWSPDGRHIASGSKDGTVHVWEAVKARSAFVYHPQHRSDLPFWIQTVVWSPQPGDKRIASSGGSSADGIQIWRAFTGQVLLTYREHPDVTRSLAWSSNGKSVASGGGRKIHVWDATTGNSMLAYRGHAKAISDLAWSPDNQRIASCGDKAVQIRMARDGKHVFTYKGHSSNVSTVMWSPDGKYLASAGGGTVQIWEADTGALLEKMNISLRGASEYATWSPKEPYLALTGERNTIEIRHIS